MFFFIKIIAKNILGVSLNNDDLRIQAVRAVKNYMHYETHDLSRGKNMMPFLHDQAEKLMDQVDDAIDNTRSIIKFAQDYSPKKKK